ncbi:MAG: hypothetical protein AAF725_26255 [Acidobacteriota bacterium]
MNLIFTCRDLGDCEGAEQLLNEAIRIEEGTGAPMARLGTLHLLLAMLKAEPEHPKADLDEAAGLARHWRRHLDDERREAADALVIYCLAHTQKDREELTSRLLLFMTAPRKPKEPLEQAHRQWLEGVARRSLGFTAHSIQLIGDARAAFFEIGLTREWAMASLDLAVALVASGEEAEASRIAGDLFRLYQAVKKEELALSPLQLFTEACASGSLDEGLIREARRTLGLALGRHLRD